MKQFFQGCGNTVNFAINHVLDKKKSIFNFFGFLVDISKRNKWIFMKFFISVGLN